MAGQGIGRRDMIRVLSIAAAAGKFPGFRRWTFACEHLKSEGDGLPHHTNSFVPQFFSQDEFQLLDRLSEMIIPLDEYPGAHDAGVAEFIDFMVASEADLSGEQQGRIQERFRFGLEWINAKSKSLYRTPFLQSSKEQQTQLLERLAYRDRFQKGDEAGQKFFLLMRDYTAKGYYTSRIGLEALGSPELQTMWAEMPGCPHLDDPEHLHLPPPIV
jgi:gluconate 2-dehydrogenase gamma chain